MHFFPFHILLFLFRVTLLKGQFSNSETLGGWSFLHNLKTKLILIKKHGITSVSDLQHLSLLTPFSLALLYPPQFAARRILDFSSQRFFPQTLPYGRELSLESNLIISQMGAAELRGRGKENCPSYPCFLFYHKSVYVSGLALCDPKDCSPPGSSVHGILQARILENPRDRGAW